MTWSIVIGVIVVIVVVVVVMALLDGDPDGLNVLDVLDCCSLMSILVVASLVMLSGLVFWHHLLLAAGAGASMLTVILLGWAVALRKQFLAKGKS